MIGLSVRASVCPSVRLVRKKWLSPFCSIYWCYIHKTCTNCSPWLDLLIPHGAYFPWPTFHAWVTMVRKKWLSLYYSTYWCYIQHTCTNCSSWRVLLMPHGGLRSWPTFHAWVTMVRKKCKVFITVPMGATFTKLTSTVHLDMFWCHVVVCVLGLLFMLQWPRHKMAVAGPLWWFPSQ